MIFLTLLMHWLNVFCEMILVCRFKITLLAWILDTFMDWLFMSCKINFLCWLKITQWAGIFLIFMSRLDVSVQRSCTRVFSLTLTTLVINHVMNTGGMTVSTLKTKNFISKMVTFKMSIEGCLWIKSRVADLSNMHFQLCNSKNYFIDR